MCTLTLSKAQGRGSSLESTQTICERDSSANLKASAEGSEDCRDSLWRQRHWWTFLHSPFAMLHSAIISWRGAFAHVWYHGSFISGAPVFAVATQGIPLEYLALEAMELYSWVPQDCNNQRILGRLLPPGH